MDFLTEQLAQVGWFIVLLFMLLIGLAFLMRRKLGLNLPALTRLTSMGWPPAWSIPRAAATTRPCSTTMITRPSTCRRTTGSPWLMSTLARGSLTVSSAASGTPKVARACREAGGFRVIGGVFSFGQPSASPRRCHEGDIEQDVVVARRCGHRTGNEPMIAMAVVYVFLAMTTIYPAVYVAALFIAMRAEKAGSWKRFVQWTAASPLLWLALAFGLFFLGGLLQVSQRGNTWRRFSRRIRFVFAKSAFIAGFAKLDLNGV